jgi:hypothetical protein
MGRARDLANILSSSGNVALDSELGLSLITPTSITATGGSGSISTTGAVIFTSASAISLNGVFSATYHNYLLRGNLSGTGGNIGDFRLRVSGADDSTSNYVRQTINADSTTLTAATQTTTSWTQFFIYSTANVSIFEAIITNPFATEKTGYFSRSTQEGTSLKIQGGTHNVSSSFTGFTLLAQSAQTITGTIRVYGYRN